MFRGSDAFVAGLSAALMCGAASAEIVYSGPLNVSVVDSGSATVSINGYDWDFGFQTGGPLNYAFLGAETDHAGVFATGAESFQTRNFASGENIGVPTPWLFMNNPGDTTYDYTIFDYATGSGSFSANGSGYAGFAFGQVGNRNYGWMSFDTTYDVITEAKTITLTGWAYESEAGTGIDAGMIPSPGAIALLGLAGLTGRRRRSDS